jgi:hypothetical protein
MKQDTNVPPHNYLAKIRRMWVAGALPRTAGYHQITVYHDDDCGIFTGKRCDCDPDIKLRFSLSGHAHN